MITPKSMMRSKNKSAVRGAAAVVFVFVAAALAVRTGAQETARASRPEAADDKRWQTVAPGRVEPSSGEVRIAAPVMGVIAQVLVKVNDKVTAGEPLIRLVDDEAQARLAAAEAQVAFRLRARNDETAPPRRTARRRAEDAVANADNAVVEALHSTKPRSITAPAGHRMWIARRRARHCHRRRIA